jgi:hypothetical protein
LDLKKGLNTSCVLVIVISLIFSAGMPKVTMSLDKTKNKLMSIDILDVSWTNEKLKVSFDESQLHKGEKWKYLVLILILSFVSVAMVIDERADIAIFPGLLSLIFIAGFIQNFALLSNKEILEITNERMLFSNRFNSYKERELALQTITSIEYSKKSTTLHLFSPRTHFEVAFEATDKQNKKHVIFEIASKYSDLDRKSRKICNLPMNYVIDTRKKRIP